jgi:hypothetical protein
MLTYLGSLSLAVAIPLLGLLDLTLGPFVAELQAKLAAMIKLSLAASLTLPAVTAAAMLQAAAKLSAAPPQVGLTASLAAAAVVTLQARIQLLVQLTKWNATAGVHMFVYEGPVGGMAAAMAAVPAQAGLAPETPVYATILMGGAGATKVALQAVFKTP